MHIAWAALGSIGHKHWVNLRMLDELLRQRWSPPGRASRRRMWKLRPRRRTADVAARRPSPDDAQAVSRAERIREALLPGRWFDYEVMRATSATTPAATWGPRDDRQSDASTTMINTRAVRTAAINQGIYVVAHQSDATECRVRVSRVTQLGGQQREQLEPTAKKRVVRTPLYDRAGSFCQPLQLQ